MFENPKRMRRWIVIAVAIGLVCSVDALAVKPVTPAESAAYTIVPFMPVGSLSTSSSVCDINDQGQAVGVADVEGGGNVAVHFDVTTGVYTSLQDGIRADGVNDRNETVGVMQTGDFVHAAFWSSPSAFPVSLPPFRASELPPGTQSIGTNSGAFAINNDGIVIGGSTELLEVDNGDETYSYDTVDTVVVWRVIVDGVSVDGPFALPPLYAGIEGVAHDINETMGGTAQIVGRSGDQAVVWSIELSEDGTLIPPEAPMPVLTPATWSVGMGINKFMDVSGHMQSDSLGFGAPFVAIAGQEPQVLPLPRKVSAGSARDINDDGDIVGYVTEWTKFYPGRDYAQLWRGGERIDLATQIPHDSGWERLSIAWVINNHGVIGGGGVFDVYHRGFIMIPNEN